MWVDMRVLACALAAMALAVLPACAAENDEAVASGDAELAEDTCSGKRTDLWMWGYGKSMEPVLSNVANKDCLHVWVNVPLLVADKTTFHGNVKDEIAAVHKYGPNFHAVAEFNMTAWRQWVQDNKTTWTAAGREFRKRMDAAGFDVRANADSDTWFVQELPSTVVFGNADITADQVRANAVEIVAALHDGGAVKKMGAVTRANVGQMSLESDYAQEEHKKRLEGFLSDAKFWNAMETNVRFWLEEVYADAHAVCVPNENIAAKSHLVNVYTYSLARLASAEGVPASTSAARSFFGRRFVPLMNAAYARPKKDGYGDNAVSVDVFEKLVSLQTYAARTWPNVHDTSQGNLGFAWAPDPAANDAEVARLGKRIGQAVTDSHAVHPSRACSPSGAFTFCGCELAGAKAVPAWNDLYQTW